MSNPGESDASTERFDGYEAELKLVQADISQKLEQLPDQSGEERKSSVQQIETLIDEAKELLGSMRLEKSNIPIASKTKINQRYRNHESDVDAYARKLASLSSGRATLFGSRYKDDPDGGEGDDQLAQRQQLLSGTERLTRSSQRLRDTERIANETEGVGAGVLRDLAEQRQTLTHARDTLHESEGYTDRSIKTLRGMARRMATNRIITISIITILVILIIAVVVSKFR